MTSLPRNSRGAVYVEYMIVFPPLFVLFLATIQLGLMFAANLGVQHASSVAARTAVVVIPDHPARYGMTPPNMLMPSDDCGEQSPSSVLSGLGGALSQSGSSGGATIERCKGGPRVSAIRSAAIIAMLPFAPNPSAVFPGWAADFGGDLGSVIGAGIYNFGAVAVSFPSEPGADTVVHPLKQWGEAEPVTVRVTYLYHCGIPIASQFMCDTFADLRAGVSLGAIRRGDIVAVQRSRERIGAGSPLRELLEHSAAPAVLLPIALSGQRFRVLSADATLPNQGANYDYDLTRAP